MSLKRIKNYAQQIESIVLLAHENKNKNIMHTIDFELSPASINEES